MEVYLPRFTVDPPEALALREILETMGMPLVFDDDHADLSGIAAIDAAGRVSVSDVYHKGFVKADEEGTEAAATTAVELTVVGAHAGARPEPPPEVFRADHPFLFFIRDLTSGVILFAGRVDDPRAR